MGVVRMFGDWRRLGGVLTKTSSVSRWRNATKRAVLKEAHRIRRLMVQSFNRGGPEGVSWPPLSETTLLMRKAMGFKGTKPMMRTGDLRNSITVVEVGHDGAFVGFHRETLTKDGKPAHSIMAIHEFGTFISVPVTPAVRGFFSVMSEKSGGKLKPIGPDKTLLLIKIPPRPVVGPIWESEKDISAQSVITDVLNGVGFQFGRAVPGGAASLTKETHEVERWE